MMVETYWRRGRRNLQRLLLEPGVRRGAAAALFWGSGFLISGAALGNYPQPLAAGLIVAATGWRALAIGLGAMMGYASLWGPEGRQGLVWAASAALLALLLGKRQEAKEQPLMMPAIAAFLTAVAGLTFRLWLREDVPLPVYALRVAVTFLAGVLFTQAARCRDPVTDWIGSGVAVLALARLTPLPQLGLGYIAAGLTAVCGAFPAAALAGLGLDLARVTAVPMTGVMCLAGFLRMIPFPGRWQQYAMPGAACIAVLAVCGIRDLSPLPGLFLGGALGALLPPKPEFARRRGETGMAQVRLELGAQVLRTQQQLMEDWEPLPIDGEALLERAVSRACGGCSARNGCLRREQLTLQHLENPLDVQCPRQDRLLPELDRARERLRVLRGDRQRQREYRSALIQQYRFLEDYLRSLGDRLSRRGEPGPAEFRIQVSARSRGRERTNGDRCLAFSGGDCRYFVLLCDGMGTGLGAAWEGQHMGSYLKKMLGAGFPAEHALGSLNSMLALRGCAGAVTVDLAEVRLDTGQVNLYKWGAAPSWLLTRGKAKKIGTATPPPGLSAEERKQTVDKLSLRQGEVLILLSDGVQIPEDPGLSDLAPDWPPGELAARILERGKGTGEDDATAAVIRLTPVSMVPS